MIAPNRSFASTGGFDDAGFFGAELLTWILWRAATGPRFAHPDGTEVWIHADEHLELRGEQSAARRVALRGGVPAASREVRAGLRSGKAVAALRLLVARGEEEVRVTLKGDTVDLSSVRLPAPEGETSEERAAASLDALDRLLADLDLVFTSFVAVRATAGWQEEVGRMAAWAAQPSEEETAVARG